jgi:hypothetical protein
VGRRFGGVLLRIRGIRRDPQLVESAELETIAQPSRLGRRWLELAIAASLIVALWAQLRPYRGIAHDARLYALQALNTLQGDTFRGDLYFQHGSQDQFSLLSRPYADAISVLGLSSAHLLLTVAAQTLWLLALVFLVRSLVKESGPALLSVILALAVPGTYGGLDIFSYGEPFFSPRPLAEALTIAGLCLMMRGRVARSWMVLTLAAVIHPIMALPGLAFATARAAAADRRWAWLPAGLAASGVGAAFLGIEPFGRLLVQVDPEWEAIIRARAPHLFVTQWTVLDIARLATMSLLACAGAIGVERRMRGFVGLSALVGLGGVLLSAAGADLGHNALAIGVQLWRSQWLLSLAAEIAAGTLVYRAVLGAAPAPCRLLLLSGIALLLATHISSGFYAATPVMFLLALPSLCIERLSTNRRLRIAGDAVAILGLMLGAALAAKATSLLQTGPELWSSVADCLAAAAAVGASIGFVRFRNGRSGHGSLACLSLLSAALLSIAAASWDRRSAWDIYIESGGPPPELTALLPEGRSVFWENGVSLLWLKLRRPSYFSCPQGAGVAFFRPTAIDYAHRAESFRDFGALDLEHSPRTYCPGMPIGEGPAPTAASIARACRREPALDYLVLSNPVAPHYVGAWRAPVGSAEGARGGRSSFYIYRCLDFRPGVPLPGEQNPNISKGF